MCFRMDFELHDPEACVSLSYVFEHYIIRITLRPKIKSQGRVREGMT